MIALWIVLALVLVAGTGMVLSYNRFVAQRNLIRAAWANIDTELRRRYDLIPNLVETVKGYAAHEREVFEDVARTRSAAQATTGTPAEQAAAEGPLVAALSRLLAVAESYPQLRANENFLALQQELAATEDRIQAARSLYNGGVQDYNRRVRSFPSGMLASMAGFREAQFFEIPEQERSRVERAPRVDFAPAPAPLSAPGGAPPPPAPGPGRGSDGADGSPST